MYTEKLNIPREDLIREVAGSPIIVAQVECADSKVGYKYKLVFVSEHPAGSYIRIDTERRSVFLSQGFEAEAEEALKQTTFAVREKTGGCISVHPFYGVVWGTEFSTVVKDFGPNSHDGSLSMIIYLTDSRGFNDRLTKEFVEIGLGLSVPSPEFERYTRYRERANKANPNQMDRDQAIANGLGDKWNIEYGRYNDVEGTPSAITITPESITDVMQHIQSDLGFENVVVSKILLE